MKTKFLSALLCMVALFIGTACSDDDEYTRPADPNKLLFQVDELERTTSTYTFRISASDDKTPYLCLYVDKDVIDQVQREELHRFLMDDLKKQAEEKGVAFEQYLASISHRGDIPELKLTGLLTGNIYELVIFGINGTQPAKKPHCHYFETLKADFVDCNFNVEVDAQVGSVTINVKPDNKEVKWYGTVVTKSSFMAAQSQGMNVLNMLATLFTQDLERQLGFMSPDGTVTPEMLDQVLNQLLKKGDVTLGMNQFSGLLADTDYVFMAVAIHVTPDFELLFISNPAAEEFHSKPAEQTGVTFDMQIQSVTQTHAHFTITPSDLKQAYVWRCEPYNPTTEKMTPKELAEYIVATNPYIFFEARPHGKIEYPDKISPAGFKLTPGTKHYLVAFGFAGGICTEVVREDIEPEPAGDPMSTEFEVEVVDKNSGEVVLKVTPSDNTVFYMPLLYPSGEDKEVMKGRLMSNLNRWLAQQQQLNPYATIWDAIAQQCIGTEVLTWSVKAGEKLTLMIVTFNKEGIAGERYFNADFVTVPGISETAKVDQMSVVGVFDGNDENGEIFGNAYATKDKAIVALSFQSSDDVVKAFSALGIDEPAIDELNPEELTDDDLFNSNNLQWSLMNTRRPHMFMVTDWGDGKSIAYSFGFNAEGERGSIARAKIPAPEQADKQDIAVLKQLVDELNAENASAFMAPAKPEWNSLKKEFDFQRCLPKMQRTEAEETIRVPYRPSTKAGADEFAQPALRVSTYLPVSTPV